MELRSAEHAARTTMDRSAGVIFLVGSLVTALSILFPHSAKADIGGFWALAAATGLMAALLLGWAGRLPVWSHQIFMGLGSVMISLALYFNGERHGGHAAGNEVLYVWIALYSGYFFTRVQTMAQIAIAATTYAVSLVAIDPGPVAFTRWFITVAMVGVSGGLVSVLKSRGDTIVGQLSEAARTDRMTGLLNREGFEERYAHEFERARRTEQPLALVLGDLDGLKSINDCFGHSAGDTALAQVGVILCRARRRIDAAARIGGDEFALVLPATDAAGGLELAERLREEVGALQGHGQKLTMSFGIAELPAIGATQERLMIAADQALYEAKGLGRDRTVVHLPEQAPQAS